MLRLRPYQPQDAETILSWINDAGAFYKWTAGVLGDYPLTAEQFNEVQSRMAFTAIDDEEIAGFFIMRRPTESFDVLRFGFVVVDSGKRGKGYGKRMLQLGLKYAKEIFGAKRVTLGVFKNNEPAYRCYKSLGFQEYDPGTAETYSVLGEEWECLELEILL